MLLLDQNLSRKLCVLLSEAIGPTYHAVLIGQEQTPDRDIWALARERGWAVITKDHDFVDFAAMYGTPPKIILFRGGNGPNRMVAALLLERAEVIRSFLADPESAVLYLP
jgi:predicted nuclease of predicted toxin-antitoxin system